LQQSLLSFRALGLTEKFMHNHESFFKTTFHKYVKYVKIFLVGHFWHFFTFKQKNNIAFFSRHANAGLKTFFNIFLNASVLKKSSFFTYLFKLKFKTKNFLIGFNKFLHFQNQNILLFFNNYLEFLAILILLFYVLIIIGNYILMRKNIYNKII
jgi:hypothetical protein